MVHPYREYDKHFVAVDVIIFGFDKANKLKLLVIRRDFQPERNKWSLMGGFLREGETMDAAAERILKELTGLENIYLEQIAAYGDLQRDSAARVISIAYYALINSEKFDDSYESSYQGRWFTLEEIPSLIFDHNVMVEKALRRLRRRCRTQPVGLELLPEKFTLPQLLKLYEAIYQQDFDKRNFRKKILSNGVLVRLDEKNMLGSKKGAFLYRFDKKKYNELVDRGLRFEI